MLKLLKLLAITSHGVTNMFTRKKRPIIDVNANLATIKLQKKGQLKLDLSLHIAKSYNDAEKQSLTMLAMEGNQDAIDIWVWIKTHLTRLKQAKLDVDEAKTVEEILAVSIVFDVNENKKFLDII